MSTRSAFWVALVLLVSSACSFESDLVSDVTCSSGDTRADGAQCIGGYWVGGDLDADIDPDGGDEVDMNVETDAGGDAGCTAEDDQTFCARVGFNCGVVEAIDNCGDNRQTNCGACDPGESCDDNVCSCEPEDDVAFCTRLSKDCGMVTDNDNCGMERTADCGSCQGNETCGEQAPNVCGCPCNIGGTCYPEGAVNPDNQCEVCDTGESTTDWTLDVGRSCNDGDLCTENDVCAGNGTCSGSPKNCSGQDGECRTGMCDASTGMCFGMAETGTSCADDGVSCTDDVCNAGTCEHNLAANFCLISVTGTPTCFSANTSNPNNGCEACKPGTSTTNWSVDNAGTCSDGLSCTTDTCNAGTCQSTVSAGRCLIGGTCFNNGQTNPNDACEECNSSADDSDWVVGSNCCSIGGTNYADGTQNPTNDCQQCATANDVNDWSPVGVGTACCPGEGGTWACNSMEICEKSNGTTMMCAP